MLKLRRLKIVRYRNVKPGSELRFDEGLNLVLGVNASGKTTLLALISAVCRSTFDGIKHEEFELEYEYGSERFAIEAKVSHRRAATEEPQGLGGGPLWDDRYEVTLTESGSGRSLTLRSDEGRGGRRVDLVMEWSFIAALLSNREQVWSDARSALFESFGQAFRFDESLDCFAAMTGRRSALIGPESTPPARHEYSSRDAQNGSVVVSGGEFMPAGLVAAFRKEFRGGRPGAEQPAAEVEAFTRAAAEHLDVSAVKLTPGIRARRVIAGESYVLVEGFDFEITRPDGATIHHDRLSYGQKRLLSFLYYLACNPAVVIADELVNGLHHRWIDACMKKVSSRQAFLTSQNPLLFDYAEFQSIEQVERRFIVCGLEQVDGREVMVWRNMNRSDAEVFYRAYEAGIEHVGDILITRGLW